MTSDSRSINDELGDVRANLVDLANDEPRFHGGKFTVHS
jgi:hypothetical protein